MNRLLRRLLLVFVISNSAFAQENVKLNIIVAINNTLVNKGKLDFIIGDEKKDTIHSMYNIGEVFLKDSDYVKLALAQKCDIVYMVKYTEPEGGAPILETYCIHSVEEITDFKVFIITLYENKRRKKNNYISGVFGQRSNLFTYYTHWPKARKERKLYWNLVKGIGGGRYCL